MSALSRIVWASQDSLQRLETCPRNHGGTRTHNTGSHLATFYNTARYHFVSMRVVSIVCPNLIPSPLFLFLLSFAPQRHFNARLQPTFSTSGRWWWWLFIGMMSRPTTVVEKGDLNGSFHSISASQPSTRQQLPRENRSEINNEVIFRL